MKATRQRVVLERKKSTKSLYKLTEFWYIYIKKIVP